MAKTIVTEAVIGTNGIEILKAEFSEFGKPVSYLRPKL